MDKMLSATRAASNVVKALHEKRTCYKVTKIYRYGDGVLNRFDATEVETGAVTKFDALEISTYDVAKLALNATFWGVLALEEDKYGRTCYVERLFFEE